MFINRSFIAAISLAALAVICSEVPVSAQTVPAAQPRPEAVAKLIVQLSNSDFRSRQQASDELEKLGAPVLPALRKATTMSTSLEAKRRIEYVVNRIESVLLKAEEKRWEDLDVPRRSVKDRLGKILARAELSDQQVASAVYLLTVARSPTDDEVAGAKKQLAGNDGRPANVLQLARALVRGKEFSAKVADANGRLLKSQKDLAGKALLEEKVRWLRSAEFQKLTEDLGASLDKAVKTDEQVIDLTFLLVMSRFPTSTESKTALTHLKKASSRPVATADIFWAMMNTKEFLMAP